MQKEFIFKEEITIAPLISAENKIGLNHYRQVFKIDIVSIDGPVMEFDLIGIYPGLVNAFRRILLSEVPTMAIEKVYIVNNTSVLQDEILAHRLGLIPLKADPRLFQFKPDDSSEGTDRDTLNFELKIKCTKNPLARYGHKKHEDIYINYQVLSSHIKWVPIGDQKAMYKESDVGPSYDDIVIAKLRPGLEIDVKMEAVKGIGRDHAKFSPVGTASYRLHPFIHLTEKITGSDIEKLLSSFSPDVIGVREENGTKVAYVKNARYDTCSRNIFRYEELAKRVKTGFVPDHYIFTIESVVGATPSNLFKEAVKLLKQKCVSLIAEIKELCEESESKGD